MLRSSDTHKHAPTTDTKYTNYIGQSCISFAITTTLLQCLDWFSASETSYRLNFTWWHSLSMWLEWRFNFYIFFWFRPRMDENENGSIEKWKIIKTKQVFQTSSWFTIFILIHSFLWCFVCPFYQKWNKNQQNKEKEKRQASKYLKMYFNRLRKFSNGTAAKKVRPVPAWIHISFDFEMFLNFITWKSPVFWMRIKDQQFPIEQSPTVYSCW